MAIRIFISYCEPDKNKMRALARVIKKYPGLEAIVIADARHPSELLSLKVKEGIASCTYFIPILTSLSYKTQWLNQETGYATGLHKTIIPIIEEQVIPKLKGFIHAQMDLPYSYPARSGNLRYERALFLKEAQVLVADILLSMGVAP